MNETIWATIYRRPVTGLVSCLAVAMSLWWWSGDDISWLVQVSGFVETEPWNLWTSTLLHADVVHLIFNIYWFSIFGSRIEGAFGSVKTGALLIVLAGGSSLVQYAFDNPGVGLSGVVYGYFAFLYVLARSDARFASVVTRKVTLLFVAWFFLCIALTVAGLWYVGNYAHAGGALLGALIGCRVVAETPMYRRLAIAGVFAAVVVAVLGATILRPHINSSAHMAYRLAYQGWQDLEKNDNERAAGHFQQAVDRLPSIADWWFNLGVAYYRLERYPEAVKAYERATTLDPKNPEFQETLSELQRWMADQENAKESL